MYKLRKALFALILIFSLTVSQVSANSILGSELIQASSYEISSGVELTSNVFFNEQVGQQTENFITYKPNKNVMPIVAYNDSVFGKADINAISNNIKLQGHSVLAGINADFFSLQTGVPMGIVVSDGRLITSDDNRYAIGFDNNNAFIGNPKLNMTLSSDDFKMNIDHFNKYRQPYGIYLLNRDFSATTKNSTSGIDIILSPTVDNIKIGGSITAVVEKVLHSARDIEIPEGKMVLTIDNKAPEQLVEQMNKIVEGQMVEISITTSDERFLNANYAVGGYDKLITNGIIETEFEMTGVAPRTALGIKEDGGIVLYTIDGRQNGYSYGILMKSLATRLKELGCVEALNLDGGGSTSIVSRYPGNTDASLVNKPSDGKNRSCANYIFLISDIAKTGILGKLHLYPQNINILSGASLDFDIKATDTAFYRYELNKNANLNIKSDSVSYSIIKPYTIAFKGEGMVQVEAKFEKATGNAVVNVYKNATNISLSNEETKENITSLSVAKASKINLSAKAGYNNIPLYSNDKCFNWRVEGDIGKIDSEGIFTAVNSDRKRGKILVNVGDKTQAVDVFVGYDMSVLAFSDIANHWAKDKLNNLYYNDIINGSFDKLGNKYFRPDDTMNRAEFCVMMANYLKIDLQQYKNTTLPFNDINTIPNWALNQVKAMYAMGITKGQQQGKVIVFNPLAEIKRAEAMTIIERTIKSNVSEEKINFADLNEIPSWSIASITKLVNLKIVNGYQDNTIKPNNILKRAEAATIIYETIQKVNLAEK
jgi:exopolysaccharide biosynthesis protein